MSKLNKSTKNVDSLITDRKTIKKPFFSATLFSRGKKMKKFFTEDSRLYITPQEAHLLSQGVKLNRAIGQWDSLSARIVSDYQKYAGDNSFLWKQWQKKALSLQEKWQATKDGWRNYLTPPRFWNATVVGAILLGMFSMNLIYKYLGPSTSANNNSNNNSISLFEKSRTIKEKSVRPKSQTRVQIAPQILGVSDEKIDFSSDNISESEFIDNVASYLQEQEKKKLEKKIRQMVKGYPIEKMLPYIMTKDRTTIAFLIGIAKKESNWGKRVPVLRGADCYNYWGYRGRRRLMGSGGHTCFNSRKDAVDTVAKRIKYLSENRKLNTPQKMVIWKCGNSCHKHSQQSVRKWISDVGIYFNQLDHD